MRGAKRRGNLGPLWEGFAVLNDTPVACQTREPTDPQGDLSAKLTGGENAEKKGLAGK